MEKVPGRNGSTGKFWIVASLFLLFLIPCLVLLREVDLEKTVDIKTIHGNSIPFPEKFVNSAMEINKDSGQFYLCSIPQNKCVKFRRIK